MKAARSTPFAELYRFGAPIVRTLDGVRTFEEIGAELGMSRQQVYGVCCVAVGKLVCEARRIRERGANASEG